MMCRVHDTVNRWAEGPGADWYHRATATCRRVQEALPDCEVRLAGSVNNRTATICSSDVDLHVLHPDHFAYDPPPDLKHKCTACQEAFRGTLGEPVPCGFEEFRESVEERLMLRFAYTARGRAKSLYLFGMPGLLDGDVVSALSYRRYSGDRAASGAFLYAPGVELRGRGRPDDRIIAYPELRRQAIERFDREAAGRYRPIVRILKCVCRSFRACNKDALRHAADGIPSCLIESLLATVNPSLYHHHSTCHWPVLMRVLRAVVATIAKDAEGWRLWDLGGVVRLFDRTQTWERDHVLRFLQLAVVSLETHQIPLMEWEPA